MAKYLLIK